MNPHVKPPVSSDLLARFKPAECLSVNAMSETGAR